MFYVVWEGGSPTRAHVACKHHQNHVLCIALERFLRARILPAIVMKTTFFVWFWLRFGEMAPDLPRNGGLPPALMFSLVVGGEENSLAGWRGGWGQSSYQDGWVGQIFKNQNFTHHHQPT